MKTMRSIISGLCSTCSLSCVIAFPLLLLVVGFVLAQPCAGAGGTWSATGSLDMERGLVSATLLPDGKVLAAGGYS